MPQMKIVFPSPTPTRMFKRKVARGEVVSGADVNEQMAKFRAEEEAAGNDRHVKKGGKRSARSHLGSR
jgi:CRISPR/Cas system endoribonuclease Cas6 (RAMP superfamily)